MKTTKLFFLLGVAVLALLPSVAAGENTPPVIDPAVPNLVVRNTDPSFTIDLTPFETDAEDSDLQLTWSVSGVDTTLGSASVDPVTDVFTWTPVPTAVGWDGVSLTVTDSGDLTDTQDIIVTISVGPTTNASPAFEMFAGGETVYLWQFDSVQANNSGQVMFYANSKLAPSDGAPEGACVIAYGDGGTPTLMVADGDPAPVVPGFIDPGRELFICHPAAPGTFDSVSDPQFNNVGAVAFKATVVYPPSTPERTGVFVQAGPGLPPEAVALDGMPCPTPLAGILELGAMEVIDFDDAGNVLYAGWCSGTKFHAVGSAGDVGTKFIAAGDLAPGGAGGTITVPASGSLAGTGVVRASGAASCSGGTGACGGGGGGRVVFSGEPGSPPEKVVITGDTWFSGDPMGDVTFTDIDIDVPPIILPDDSVIFQATASDPYGPGYFVRNADGTTEKLVLENDPAYAGGSTGPITFGGGGGGVFGGGGGGGAVVLGISDSYNAGDPAFERITAYPSGELIDYVGEPLDGGDSITGILSTHVSDDGSQSGTIAEAQPGCGFSNCQNVIGKPVYAVIIDEGDGISWLDESLNKCGIDADGDGALDWSFDLDGDGTCDVDPHRRDIFTEIDYMDSTVPPVDDSPADGIPDDDLPADTMEDGVSTCNDSIENGGGDGADINDADCHTDGNAGNSASYNPTFSEDGVTACNDGLDNGSDGYIDDADPECHVHMPAGVAEDGVTGVYSCEDSIDPDGDNPDVINGQIDLNDDATVDALDDGRIAGVSVIDGGIDISGDGTVDGTDDGSLIGLNVTDGGIDIDEDGVITSSDNGSLGELGDPDCSVVAAFANAPVHNPTSDEDDIATCEDSVDNGGPAGPDGKTDIDDEDCHTDRTLDPGTYDPKLPEDLVYGTCDDALDNGGADGKTDAEDPDCTGVDLHVLIDEAVAHAKYLDFFGSGTSPCTGPMGGQTVTDEGASPPQVKIREFDKVKGTPNASPPDPVHFGTPAARAVVPAGINDTSNTGAVNPGYTNPVASMAARIAARFQVTHYVLFSHRQAPFDGNASGCGEMPGNDFFVSLGGWNLNGTAGQVAGTLMHELGHNLNLRHGGGDDVNYKPNYLSVMNYTFQMPTTPDGQSTGRPLDYSRWELPPSGTATCAGATVGYLNEAGLDEDCGIDNDNPPTSPSGFSAWNTAYTYVLGETCPFQVTSATGDIDWDKDTTIGTVSANINDPLYCTDTERDPLYGHDDWNSLLYNVTKTAGYADGMPHGPVVPERGPPGDSDGDGVMDPLDDAPGLASADFSDTALGGATLGEIVSGAVSIADADDPDDGVLLFATEASRVSMCDDFATIDLEELGAVVATCINSAEVTIVQGPANVRAGPVFGAPYDDPAEGCYTATIQTGSTVRILELPPPAAAFGLKFTHHIGSVNVTMNTAGTPPDVPPMNPHGIPPGQNRQDDDADCVFQTGAGGATVDNCPDDSNRDQTNTDADNETAGFTFAGAPLAGDSDGDACDTDDDNDGFSDTVEQLVFGVAPGSPEELTPCRTASLDDPWPPDIFPLDTPDRLVDGQDLVAFLPGLFKGLGQPGYSARLDIWDPPEVIDGQDLVAMLPFLFEGCTPP